MFYQRAPRRKTPTKSQAGAAAENAAVAWLEARALICVERNFRCRGGEIDLIMRDHHTLVFVEVRLRSRNDFGSAAESVTARKQRRIVHAAQFYLATHAANNLSCRFDVLAATQDGATVTWEWVQNAFDAG